MHRGVQRQNLQYSDIQEFLYHEAQRARNTFENRFLGFKIYFNFWVQFFLTISLPCFSVQIKHKICKNTNSHI